VSDASAQSCPGSWDDKVAREYAGYPVFADTRPDHPTDKRDHCPTGAWAMFHHHLLDLGGGNGCLKCVLYIGVGHASGQFPGENVGGEVVQYSGNVIVTPARDLELGEIRLP
jgi:hypothetical protein